jgi:hypothetical protein
MNKTMTKVFTGLALVLSLGAVSQAAEAHVNWSIGINVPGPYYGAPAYYPQPVYVAPPPVYYPPAPVYYQPRPVYYQQPAPVYYSPGYRHLPPPMYSPHGYWDHGVFYRR